MIGSARGACSSLSCRQCKEGRLYNYFASFMNHHGVNIVVAVHKQTRQLNVKLGRVATLVAQTGTACTQLLKQSFHFVHV